MSDILHRLERLEADVRQQNRTIAGIQHYLRVASEYKNESPEQVVAAIQAALGLSAKYEGRDQRRRRNG